VGGLSPVDLGKMLSGQIANASLSMGPYTHGVGGGSTPKDLETALQLMYLSFTAANHDPDAFELMKRRLRANLENQAQSPGAVYGERVRLVNTNNHYISRSMKIEDVDALDQAKMEAFYKTQFANAADFTFFFVGTFDVAKIEPLLATSASSRCTAFAPPPTSSSVTSAISCARSSAAPTASASITRTRCRRPATARRASSSAARPIAWTASLRR
jgi:predicted Zn-dependent peptidase